MFSVRPYNTVNLQGVGEVVKVRSICRKNHDMASVLGLNVADSIKEPRVEKGFSEKVKAERPRSVDSCFVDDFFEELEVHVVVHPASGAGFARKVASSREFDMNMSGEVIIYPFLRHPLIQALRYVRNPCAI